MAKVTMPLMSASASGSIGKSMVFFGWKGVNVVRGWVKPANPESEGQGDARLLLGGTGRACSAIGVNSDYHAQMETLKLIQPGQTKQSQAVKLIMSVFLPTVSAFEALVTAYEAHSAKAGFDASAENLGLSEVDISYKGTSEVFAGGLMVYLIAKLGIFYNFTGSPYDTALASWSATELGELEADLVAA